MRPFRFGTSFSLAHRIGLAWILALAIPSAHAKPPRTDIYGDPLPDGARVRMGTMRLRHEKAQGAISADGRVLISCGSDGFVRRWDIASGRLLRQTKLTRPGKDTKRFYRMSTAANGAVAAAVERDKVYLYDTDSGREKGCLSISPITDAQLQFSSDGKRLIIADADEKESLQVWDVAARKKIRTLSADVAVDPKATSPRGDIVATRSEDDVLHLWSVATGKELRTIPEIKCGVVFMPDGKTFAAIGGNYSTVCLWEIASGKKQATFPVPEEEEPHLIALAFSPDGSRLAGVGIDTIVWDVATRKILRRFPDAYGWPAFTPDNKILASGLGSSNTIGLWDVATGKPLHQRPGHDKGVATVAVSPDGKLAASSEPYDPQLYLWDVATGRLLRRLKGGYGEVEFCLFSPDGKRILSCDVRESLQLWDVASGKELRCLGVPERKSISHSLHTAASAFSENGKRLSVVLVNLEDREHAKGQVEIWDTDRGKFLSHRPYKVDVHRRSQLSGRVGIETHAAFMPGGEGVTVRSGKRLIIEETTNGRTLAVLPENVGDPLKFSPDGQLLAAGIIKPKGDAVDGYTVLGICLIESASGQEILRIKSGEGGFLDFSHDGRWLATTDEKALHIWDLATGAECFRRTWSEEIAPHTDATPVWSLAFLPSGKGVVTGMRDGTLLVWDLPSRMRSGEEAQRQWDDKELESLWSDLAGDARKGHRAVCMLSARPEQALPFLDTQLRPAEPIDAKLLAKQLADLDSDQFAVRQQAARTLTHWGDQIHPALRRYLREKPSLEARRRIEQILTSARPVPSAATLRVLRAIRVLERTGTADARRILRRLAAGAEGASETRAAQSALARLIRRQ